VKANNSSVRARNNDTKVGDSSIKANSGSVKEKIVMQREEKTQNDNNSF
jgi:hypothetical protein